MPGARVRLDTLRLKLWRGPGHRRSPGELFEVPLQAGHDGGHPARGRGLCRGTGGRRWGVPLPTQRDVPGRCDIVQEDHLLGDVGVPLRHNAVGRHGRGLKLLRAVVCGVDGRARRTRRRGGDEELEERAVLGGVDDADGHGHLEAALDDILVLRRRVPRLRRRGHGRGRALLAEGVGDPSWAGGATVPQVGRGAEAGGRAEVAGNRRAGAGDGERRGGRPKTAGAGGLHAVGGGEELPGRPVEYTVFGCGRGAWMINTRDAGREPEGARGAEALLADLLKILAMHFLIEATLAGTATDDTGGVHAERGTWGARPSWEIGRAHV